MSRPRKPPATHLERRRQRPRAVLLIAFGQDEGATVVVVERIDAHGSPDNLIDISGTFQTILEKKGADLTFRQIPCCGQRHNTIGELSRKGSAAPPERRCTPTGISCGDASTDHVERSRRK